MCILSVYVSPRMATSQNMTRVPIWKYKLGMSGKAKFEERLSWIRQLLESQKESDDVEEIVKTNPDSLVLIDEAYVDFGAESVIPLIHKYDNLLVTGTFSKSRSLAGGRLGFGIGSKALIGDLNTIKYAPNPYNVNRMTMAAGVGTLMDEDYIQKNCQTIMEVREWTMQRLKEAGFVLTDSKANFIFAMHPQADGKEIYLRMKKKGVLIRHFDTPRLYQYNRITVGSRQQMEIFLEKLNEVLEELI